MWFVYIVTALLLMPLGYLLHAAITNGYWWTMPIWIGCCLWLGYLVGNEEDRAEFRHYGRALRRRLGL